MEGRKGGRGRGNGREMGIHCEMIFLFFFSVSGFRLLA